MLYVQVTRLKKILKATKISAAFFDEKTP